MGSLLKARYLAEQQIQKLQDPLSEERNLTNPLQDSLD